MTPEQVQQYSDALGWPPETVLAWFNYFATGQPG